MMRAIPDNLDILGCPLSGMSLIEASAGTGKTWTICGLYLRLLLEAKLAVPEILVVTFTNAATAELKERIRARILELHRFLATDAEPADADPFLAALVARLAQGETGREEARRRLNAALASFDEATISTIHGFCQKAAGTLAFGTGQPFSFTVERDEEEILAGVVHDFWRRHVAADTLDMTLAMYLAAKGATPDALVAFMKRELDKPLAEKRWPDDLAPMDPSALDALRAAYDRLEAVWRTDRETLHDTITAAVAAKDLNGNKYRKGTTDNIFAAYEQLFRQQDPVAIFMPAAATGRFWRLATGGIADGTSKGKTPPVHPFFALAEEWMALREDALHRLELAWLHLLFLLSEEAAEVRRRRRENRVLSSNDILYRLYEALADPALPDLPAALRRLYPAALIDEFQDTDPLQLFIFRTIYGGSDAPVFFVGDPKQAIYRFRNADLHTYLAARKEVSAVYSLTHNQRSTPEMIAAANALFRNNDRAFMLEGLDYLPVSPGARQRGSLKDGTVPEGDRSALVVWQLPRADDGGYLRRAVVRDAVAQAVAGEIARLLHAARNGRITLGDAPMRAEDIAVLVRTHAEARMIQDALAAHALPSVSLSSDSIWISAQADELAVILAAIVTPRNLPRLRAALATEIIGLDAAAVAELSEQDDKALAWVERFMAYQAAWLEHGVSSVLRQIMKAHDVYARMLSFADGERRMTNILHLAELLNDAGQTHAMPEALLRWMEEQRKNRPANEETQVRLESDEKLIRIMTIHTAKGLEFPVVFCPFLWDTYRHPRHDAPPGREYQAGSQLVIDFRRHDPAEAGRIDEQMALEEDADQLRLVYVALTRAIYRCYLAAGCYLQPASVKDSTSGTLNWLAAGNGIEPAEWIGNGNDERAAAIEAAWQALADGCESISLQALPDTQIPPIPVAAGETPAWGLEAADLPRAIPAEWRIGSYSALTYGAVYEPSGSDHDERVQDRLPPDAPDTALSPDDIRLFPASRYAGNCLHAVFEEVDFTDDRTWDAAIDRALLRHPPHGRLHPGEGRTPDALKPMIRRMLADVLATPLHDGLKLSAIPKEKRLTELEFFLPAKHFSATALNTLLSPAYPVPKLTFPLLQGYLKGLIDLVVEHRGRFYILDWKSNFLGNRQADYGEEALDDAMREHNYHLQHLLYTVALDRYLSRRLPDYAYSTHFGGILYLFVRGVRPAWQRESDEPSGVFFHRAEESLIRALGALLSSGGDD